MSRRSIFVMGLTMGLVLAACGGESSPDTTSPPPATTISAPAPTTPTPTTTPAPPTTEVSSAPELDLGDAVAAIIAVLAPDWGDGIEWQLWGFWTCIGTVGQLVDGASYIFGNPVASPYQRGREMTVQVDAGRDAANMAQAITGRINSSDQCGPFEVDDASHVNVGETTGGSVTMSGVSGFGFGESSTRDFGHRVLETELRSFLFIYSNLLIEVTLQTRVESTDAPFDTDAAHRDAVAKVVGALAGLSN